jgi:hypothetical protein
VKLVQLKRQVGDRNGDVVAAVGPMEDAEADAYAAELRDLVAQRTDFSVGTTSVESTSGAAAEPPATPADLLRAVLSSDEGGADGGHDLPGPPPHD